MATDKHYQIIDGPGSLDLASALLRESAAGANFTLSEVGLKKRITAIITAVAVKDGDRENLRITGKFLDGSKICKFKCRFNPRSRKGDMYCT